MRSYILDTGASVHFMSDRYLTEAERRTTTELDVPFPLSTGNGKIMLTHVAQVYIHCLDIFVWTHLLADAPAVLSMGQLSREHDCTFLWEPRCATLMLGDRIVQCVIRDNVPLCALGTQTQS